MAKRSRSEVLQSQARAAERRANQQINGWYPFRGYTDQEYTDFKHTNRTGKTPKEEFSNAKKLRERAWSREVEKNPKLKGLQPLNKTNRDYPLSESPTPTFNNQK